MPTVILTTNVTQYFSQYAHRYRDDKHDSIFLPECPPKLEKPSCSAIYKNDFSERRSCGFAGDDWLIECRFWIERSFSQVSLRIGENRKLCPFPVCCGSYLGNIIDSGINRSLLGTLVPKLKKLMKILI